MLQLAPSILSADFAKLGEELHTIEEAGAHLVHIDVMDGMFVPSISYGMPVIQSVRRCTKLPFDVHLMVEEPGRYIETFADCGADSITVHAEACTHLHRTVQQIHAVGKRAAVALNPATPLSVLDYVLDDLDMVLVMTVNPGFGGQRYIESMTDKIRALREEANRRNLSLDIQVDGGIKLSNVQTVLDAGANVIVGGSSVFGGETAQNVRRFLDVFAKQEQG